MSRVDDRIRARLHMQIVLRGIAVLFIMIGLSLSLLWLVGTMLEVIAMPRYFSRPTLGSQLREEIWLLSMGLCPFVMGIVLLRMTDWLAIRWVPLKGDGLCQNCSYPRDDLSVDTCPDCGNKIFTQTARNPQRGIAE